MRRRAWRRRPKPNMRRSVFRFSFRRLNALPRLAWCARIQRGCSEIVVEHGPWVEARSTFFVEGAWDGAFAQGRLEHAGMLLGSGGATLASEAIFCTTTHTMERLHGVRIGDALWLSNSFAYLLHATGDEPDVNYRYYERDFMTFLHGRRRALRSVPTARGRQVMLYYGERLHIDRELGVRAEPYADAPHLQNYTDYLNHVEALLKRLYTNADDPARARRYTPLATLSSGYDSPACAVLAQALGCSAAITLQNARRDYYGCAGAPTDNDDSGAGVATHLGMRLKVFDRDAYRTHADFPEAEFIATGNGGDDVVLAAAERELPRTLLFTGFLGDTLWGLGGADPAASRDYAYTFPAGGTFGEFRLRVGYIHVPVPLLTFTRHDDIRRISLSPDMAPWRVGGSYDRPIPRRLVETAGVPRAIYAREKKAVTQPFWLPAEDDRLRAMMSPNSYASLSAYAKEAAISARLNLASRIKMALAPLALPVAGGVNWYGRKLTRLLGIRRLPQLATGQFRPSVLFGTPAGLKFHWAVATVRRRYAATEFGAAECDRTPVSPAAIARS